jgi:hypothetical protein
MVLACPSPLLTSLFIPSVRGPPVPQEKKMTQTFASATTRQYLYPSHFCQPVSSKTRTHAHTQWGSPESFEDDEEEHEWIAGLWRLYGHPSDDGSMRYSAMVDMIGQHDVCLFFGGRSSPGFVVELVLHVADW